MQKDVDTLYAQWQKQLTLMKQGDHYTKPITFSDRGVLVGEFEPETWNAKPESTLGSTIVTGEWTSINSQSLTYAVKQNLGISMLPISRRRNC